MSRPQRDSSTLRQTISVTLAPHVLQLIDERAREAGLIRSQYVERVLARQDADGRREQVEQLAKQLAEAKVEDSGERTPDRKLLTV